MTPIDLDISVMTCSLKSRFLSSVMPSNLTVETFARIESQILRSIAFLLLEITIYEVLLLLRESLLALRSYQHLQVLYSQQHEHC